MATITVFAGAADSDILSNSASYIGAVGGAGAFTIPANSANELWVGQLFLGNYSCYQSFVDFDLSAMHAGMTVTAALMQTWLITDNTPVDFQNIALLYDWGASVTSADWQNPAALLAMNTWWTSRNTVGLGATGAYKNWLDTPDLHALLQLLAGTEVNFILASDHEWAGLAPTGAEFVTWSSSNVAGTTQDPKLTITFSDDLAPAAVPEGGIIFGGSTSGTFSSPSAPATQVDADLIVECDFDNDGDFSAGVENITAYVLACEWQTGREFPSRLTGETRPGTLKVTLDNRDSRFSYFNATSPLVTPPFSLQEGRKIRVRANGTVPNDPILLARDRFDRADGLLGTAETGQAWSNPTGSFTVRSRVAAAGITTGGDNASVIDVGVTDMYVQGTLRQMPRGGGRYIGLYVRYLDLLNWTRFDFNPATRQVRITDNNAGAFTLKGSASNIDGWEGMTVGLGVVGQAVTAYVGGAPVCTGTLTRAVSGTKAGMFAIYTNYSGRSPEIGDFHVWDHVAGEVNGILFTGDFVDLEVATEPGVPKIATITADGRLVRLAGTDVAAPRVPVGGAKTGSLVGDTLQRAGMLHPPVPLSLGAVTTGPIGIPDGDALAMARRFEDTEQGTIIETNEGFIGFQDSAARASASSMAWFTDTAGVGQYPYSAINPVSRRGQLINQVVAGVAADAPSDPTITTQNGGGGSAPFHVQITMPTVAAGDLVVVFIASTINDLVSPWLNPIWWTNHRDLKLQIGMRVYSHFCDGTETGTTVRFYENPSHVAGLWAANICRIPNWFESYNSGIAMSDPVRGGDPAPMVHGWGRFPTLFLATRVGIAATGADSYTTNFDPPDGYSPAIGVSSGSGTPGTDVAITTCWKVDCTDAENAGLIDTITGYDVVDESVVFAVRGYNGSHTKATLDDPTTVGGTGRLVTIDNVPSQVSANAVLSHRAPSDLFPNEFAAAIYGALVTTNYGTERPIIELTFYATSSAGLRAQAIARRVGHKITVTAASTDPINGTGLGIEAQFFIESMNHKVSAGGKWWEVTYALSPA